MFVELSVGVLAFFADVLQHQLSDPVGHFLQRFNLSLLLVVPVAVVWLTEPNPGEWCVNGEDSSEGLACTKRKAWSRKKLMVTGLEEVQTSNSGEMS